MHRPYLSVLALLAILACDDEPQPNPVRDALAAAPVSVGGAGAVAFRFPSGSDRATHIYRLPDLDEVSWEFESGGGHVTEVAGFADDEGLAYFLTAANHLVALDLMSGRARVVDTSVAMATVGPTGIPHLVRLDGSMATVRRRALQQWNATFDTLPTSIWGAARQRLIALFEYGDTRELRVVAEGQATISQSLPAGHLAVARWGDIAAIAVDSGVVVIDPIDPDERWFVHLQGARRLAFSPSAHRLYVIQGGRLLTLERFDLVVIASLDLPGPMSDVRADHVGRLLMLRPAGVDSVLVVDLVKGVITGGLPTEWTRDLPGIAFDGTLLTRWEGRVWATQANAIGDPVGTEGGTDLWWVAHWDPRRPALEPASHVEDTEQPPLGQMLYVQVSSSRNADWAVDFAQNLRRAGVDASVLPPGPGEELYRVVLGPYGNREEAEGTAQLLGLPFWIYTADSTGAPDSTSQFQD